MMRRLERDTQAVVLAVLVTLGAALASVIGWRLTGATSLPPLWLHLPVVMGAGAWAGWSWWRA